MHSNCETSAGPSGGLPVGGTFQWGSCRARGRPWIRWRRNWKTPSRRCTWLPPRGGAGPDFVPPGPGAGEASVEDPGHRRCPAADWRRQLHPGGHERHPSGLRPARPGGGDGDPLKLKVIFPRLRESPPGLPRSRPGWRTSCPATYRWSTSSGREEDGHAPHPPKGDGGVTMKETQVLVPKSQTGPQTLCNNLPVEVLTAEDGKTIMWMLPPKGHKMMCYRFVISTRCDIM